MANSGDNAFCSKGYGFPKLLRGARVPAVKFLNLRGPRRKGVPSAATAPVGDACCDFSCVR